MPCSCVVTLFVCSPDDQNCMIKDDNKLIKILYSVCEMRFYMVNVTADDDLVTQGARLSGTMVFFYVLSTCDIHNITTYSCPQDY